jgi:hypothetical protein
MKAHKADLDILIIRLEQVNEAPEPALLDYARLVLAVTAEDAQGSGCLLLHADVARGQACDEGREASGLNHGHLQVYACVVVFM